MVSEREGWALAEELTTKARFQFRDRHQRPTAAPPVRPTPSRLHADPEIYPIPVIANLHAME